MASLKLNTSVSPGSMKPEPSTSFHAIWSSVGEVMSGGIGIRGLDVSSELPLASVTSADGFTCSPPKMVWSPGVRVTVSHVFEASHATSPPPRPPME